MKTFKNKNFETRNYNCTNIVFCESQIAPSESWIECDEDEIWFMGCVHLYSQNGVRYFGYM